MMQRRDFLIATSLTTAGLLAGGTVFSRNEENVFGHGRKRYKLDTNWSQADFARYPVKDCHEMVQDKSGRLLLLTNETRNNVIIYDKSGKLIDSWGSEYPGAHGLTLSEENGQEVLFICDNNRHQVIKTDLKGRVLMTLDWPKESGQYEKAEEYVPTETAIAPNGDIYVADGYGKDFIIQYDSKGNYIRHFGGRGETEGHLLNAHGVCLDLRNPAQPCLVVSSRQQMCFKRYSLDGQYLSTIPLPGAWVCRPVIRGEFLYAAVLMSASKPWKQSGFVLILDKENRVVSNVAGNEPVYQNGQLQELYQTTAVFAYPHDVCVDDEENLYVAQWNSGQVYPYKLSPVT